MAKNMQIGEFRENAECIYRFDNLGNLLTSLLFICRASSNVGNVIRCVFVRRVCVGGEVASVYVSNARNIIFYCV